jgi:tetratricopeptide (TPR) repeat protein
MFRLFRRFRLAAIVLLGCVLAVRDASAQLVKGAPAPALKATDIHGNVVDLDALVADRPPPMLLVQFLFSTRAGDEIANKLAYLHTRYGKEMLQVIGLGMNEDREALRRFAEGMGIRYYIIEAASLPDAAWLENITALPVTIFIYPDAEKTIAKVIQGGGEEQANIIKEIASNFLARGQYDASRKAAEAAVEQGEPAAEAKDIVGYSYIEEGKVDAAKAVFAETGSAAGQARVAMAEGNLEQAEQILARATDAYSTTLMGTVRMLQGDLARAEQQFVRAIDMPADDWQRAEALNGRGRVLHAQGNAEGALAVYEQAIASNPDYVPALTNAAELQRSQGELEQAAKLLERATGSARADAVSDAMLRQVLEAMTRAQDTQKAQIVQQQIADLRQRYETLKAAGADKPADPWTTRPRVFASMPGASQQVFFARAGLDTVIQRELEFALQQRGDVFVVEREMLDQLLQELGLGASNLARPDTQQQLGQLLAARWLGFLEFVGAGNQVGVYLRLADAQSTALVGQVSRTFDSRADLGRLVKGMADELMNSLGNGQGPLQGLIADAAAEDAILINLGARHGAKPGLRFDLVEEGEPIQVGGRSISGRLKRLGGIEVTEVDEETAVAKLIEKKAGVTLHPEMKIRQVNP